MRRPCLDPEAELRAEAGSIGFGLTLSFLHIKSANMEKVIDTATNANESTAGPTTKIIPVSHWVPHAVAVCLMILGLMLARQILDLKTQLVAARTDAAHLRESNALFGLHLETLDAKNPSYSASKVLVAWDPYRRQGVVTMENLPSPAVGNYQLWVLDPSAEAPLNAGVIAGSRPFTVKLVNTPVPGFAVSLEPSGGSPEPTGPILFAVAPGP